MSSFYVEDRHDHSLEKKFIYRRLICHSVQSYIDFKEKVDILKKRQKKTKQNKRQSDRQADRLTSQTSYVTWEVQDHVNRRFGGAKITITSCHFLFTFSCLLLTRFYGDNTITSFLERNADILCSEKIKTKNNMNFHKN